MASRSLPFVRWVWAVVRVRTAPVDLLHVLSVPACVCVGGEGLLLCYYNYINSHLNQRLSGKGVTVCISISCSHRLTYSSPNYWTSALNNFVFAAPTWLSVRMSLSPMLCLPTLPSCCLNLFLRLYSLFSERTSPAGARAAAVRERGTHNADRTGNNYD